MPNNESALTTLENVDQLPIRDIVAYGRRAGIIPKEVGSDEAAYGIILKARELGLPVMAAFSSIHVIEGKPTCSAELMHACAAQQLGRDRFWIEFTKTTPEECEGRCTLDGGVTFRPPIKITFKEMQAAGYTHGRNGLKANWRNPAPMLRARVTAALVRAYVPGATLGMYTPDEIRDSAEVKAVPHVEVGATAARRVTAKLLGEPPPDPEAAAAAEQERREHDAFAEGMFGPAEDAPPADAQPPEDAAPLDPVELEVEDWLVALSQCVSRKEVSERCEEIAKVASRYSEEQRAKLREAASRRSGELMATRVL